MQPPKEYTGEFAKFRRYKKLSEDVIELGDGLNPSSGYINPDYKKKPSNPRKCVQCGKTHDTIVENTMTGERIEELSKCKDCMLFGTKVALGRHDFPTSNISTE